MEHNQNKNSDLHSVSDINQQALSASVNGDYELILNWYSVNSKKLLDEEILRTLPIDTLLKILGQPIWNQIYHCWSIEPKHVTSLQAYTQHQFNLEKFSYFIEVYHKN